MKKLQLPPDQIEFLKSKAAEKQAAADRIAELKAEDAVLFERHLEIEDKINKERHKQGKIQFEIWGHLLAANNLDVKIHNFKIADDLSALEFAPVERTPAEMEKYWAECEAMYAEKIVN